MTSDTSLETFVAALALAEKGTSYCDATKQFGDDTGTAWGLNAAYNISRLSENVGAYGKSHFGISPAHKLSARVKEAAELLSLGIEYCEENKETHTLLANTYNTIIDTTLGGFIYEPGENKFDDALKIVNATENILMFFTHDEKSEMSRISKKNIMQLVRENNSWGLREYLRNNPYGTGIFHDNRD